MIGVGMGEDEKVESENADGSGGLVATTRAPTSKVLPGNPPASISAVNPVGSLSRIESPCPTSRSGHFELAVRWSSRSVRP